MSNDNTVIASIVAKFEQTQNFFLATLLWNLDSVATSFFFNFSIILIYLEVHVKVKPIRIA